MSLFCVVPWSNMHAGYSKALARIVLHHPNNPKHLLGSSLAQISNVILSLFDNIAADIWLALKTQTGSMRCMNTAPFAQWQTAIAPNARSKTCAFRPALKDCWQDCSLQLSAVRCALRKPLDQHELRISILGNKSAVQLVMAYPKKGSVHRKKLAGTRIPSVKGNNGRQKHSEGMLSRSNDGSDPNGTQKACLEVANLPRTHHNWWIILFRNII